MANANTNTNASDNILADFLDGLPLGRFLGMLYPKKGKLVGRGANRKRFGDDEVHAVLFVGAKYVNVLTKSRAGALALGAKGLLAECQRRGVTGKSGAPITIADCTKALDDFIASIDRSLNGTNTSTSEHVYEPLIVGGEAVRGCKVYNGPGNPSDPKAPVPGTIYLAGLLIGQKVITPAPNGPIPASNSRGDVAAKRVLRSKTSLGRYRTYALEPGTGYMLRYGADALTSANAAGITANATALTAATDDIEADDE